MNTMTVTLADAAEWLSAQFLAPPDAAMVEAARSVRGQLLLAQMGALLDRPDEMGRLRSLLSADAVPVVVQGLQRSHVALFEGIFRNRSVAPYASVWDGTGRLFGPAVERMQRLLHDLDIRLDEGFHEPITWGCSCRRWPRRCGSRRPHGWRGCWTSWPGPNALPPRWAGWMVMATLAWQPGCCRPCWNGPDGPCSRRGWHENGRQRACGGPANRRQDRRTGHERSTRYGAADAST